MTGLIDVVVPAKNAAQYVSTFLESAQTNAPEGCRYLIIDDGSQDDTAIRLEQAAKQMPYLEVIRLESSVGVAAARNVALDRVDAQYLTFVDIDDWLAPGQLSALIAAQQRTGATMVRTDNVRVDGFRRTLDTAPFELRDQAFDAELGIGDAGGRTLVDYAWLWAGLFDATNQAVAQLRFNPALRTGSDRPWYWSLHLAGISCAVTSSPGYYYRRSSGSASLTEAVHDRLLDILPTMQNVLDIAATSDQPAHHRRAAYSAIKMIGMHIARRARLTPDLQQALVTRSAALLGGIDTEVFDAAVMHFRPAETEMAIRLRDAGRRWAA